MLLPSRTIYVIASLSNKIVWMCLLLYYASFLWEIFEECYTQYFNGLKCPKTSIGIIIINKSQSLSSAIATILLRDGGISFLKIKKNKIFPF